MPALDAANAVLHINVKQTCTKKMCAGKSTHTKRQYVKNPLPKHRKNVSVCIYSSNLLFLEPTELKRNLQIKKSLK